MAYILGGIISTESMPFQVDAELFRKDLNAVYRRLCELFQVSRAALIIRLRLLGYLIDRPYSEYYDPLEVWA